MSTSYLYFQSTLWKQREYSIALLIIRSGGKFPVSHYLRIKPNTLISHSFFACAPNLMLQILAIMISSGSRAKVILPPIGYYWIPQGHSERSRLLPCKMEGQIELCTKGCTIATELHHVHPGEDRGARRMISTCNTHHIYIKLHQSAPISLYLRDQCDL